MGGCCWQAYATVPELQLHAMQYYFVIMEMIEMLSIDW